MSRKGVKKRSSLQFELLPPHRLSVFAQLPGDRPRTMHFFMAVMKRIYLTFLTPFTIACTDVLGPLPAGAISFNPPPEYYVCWQQLEQCPGKSGNYGSVSWLVVPDSAYSTLTLCGNAHLECELRDLTV